MNVSTYIVKGLTAAKVERVQPSSMEIQGHFSIHANTHIVVGYKMSPPNRY